MKPEESLRHLKAAQLMLLGKDNQPILDLYYALQDGVDAIEEKTRTVKVVYLCDKNKPDCEKTNCGEEFCCRTTDINHAINFEKIIDEDTGEIVAYEEKKPVQDSEVRNESTDK